MDRTLIFLVSLIMALMAGLAIIWTVSSWYLPVAESTRSFWPTLCQASHTVINIVSIQLDQYCLEVTLAWPRQSHCLNWSRGNVSGVVMTNCYNDLVEATTSQSSWVHGQTTDCYLDTSNCVLVLGTFESTFGIMMLLSFEIVIAIVGLNCAVWQYVMVRVETAELRAELTEVEEIEQRRRQITEMARTV